MVGTTELLKKEIIELRKDNLRLREMVYKDGLTGLYNRRYFDQYFRQVCQLAASDKPLLALLLIDVDHFKQYNDTNGHRQGDVLLQALGRILHKTAARHDDVAARYGGEEFAIVLPKTDYDGAMLIAEKVRIAALAVDCTISIGVSCYYLDGLNPDTLIDVADARLYEAKKQGRNRVVGQDVYSMSTLRSA